MKKIVHLFGSDNYEVKREICYIFSNLTYGSDPNVLFNVINGYEALTFFAQTLEEKDAKTVEIALECLYVVLAFG